MSRVRSFVAGIFIWLIVRDACPCRFGLHRFCHWLDDVLLVEPGRVYDQMEARQ